MISTYSMADDMSTDGPIPDASAPGVGSAGWRAGSDSQPFVTPQPELSLATPLVAGVGYAVVSRNGEAVMELHAADEECDISAAVAEKLALAEPEAEWCVHLVALLDDRRYRRVGRGRWVLTRRGYGLS